MTSSARSWGEQRRREIAGEGDYPFDPKYIDEFIKGKARDGGEWAIAYALLGVAGAIRCAATQISGVDDYTGQQRMAWALEQIAEGLKKPKEDAA